MTNKLKLINRNLPIITGPYGEQILSDRLQVRTILQQTQLNKDLVDLMENAIHQKTIEEASKLPFYLYQSIYLNISQHMIANLKNDNSINNRQLIDSLNQGQVTPTQAINFNPQEMHRERWHELIEKRLMDLDRASKDSEATSTLFWCSRCHRNKTVFFERQDRCADEPMTTHITCCYCGKKWKQ